MGGKGQEGNVLRDFCTKLGPACHHVLLNGSEYQLLENGSVFVSMYSTTYNEDQYILDDNGSMFVCPPFSMNSMTSTVDWDPMETLLSVVCTIISLVALTFQFVVYMIFPVLRNTPGKCVVCLVVTLFVGQLLFLLVKTGSGAGHVFCFCQSVVMHYAFLAAFFWMNVVAVDVCRTFSSGTAASTSSGTSRRFVFYSLYAWSGAGLVVSLAVFSDLVEWNDLYRPHYGQLYCWFNSPGGLLVYFALPLGVLLLINCALFVASVCQIRRASQASSLAVGKSKNKEQLVSITAFTVCIYN
jgi:G protein-coupled receptor Mth (Methuselah protein)